MILKPSLRATMQAMPVGGVERIPVTDYRYQTVRNYCFALGFELSRKYSSQLDRDGGFYVITREI